MRSRRAKTQEEQGQNLIPVEENYVHIVVNILKSEMPTSHPETACVSNWTEPPNYQANIGRKCQNSWPCILYPFLILAIKNPPCILVIFLSFPQIPNDSSGRFTVCKGVTWSVICNGNMQLCVVANVVFFFVSRHGSSTHHLHLNFCLSDFSWPNSVALAYKTGNSDSENTVPFPPYSWVVYRPLTGTPLFPLVEDLPATEA